MSDLIGFAAGLLILWSTLPHLIHLFQHPEHRKYEVLSRNILLIAGNLLWLVFGALEGALALALMSITNIVLLMVLLYWGITARTADIAAA